MPPRFDHPHLSVLAVTGPERSSFLQGQLTQDVAGVREDATVLAGWCDPKGRLLWAGHLWSGVVDGEPALLLLVPATLAEGLAASLRRFVFRTKARVTVPAIGIAGGVGDAPGGAVALSGDPARHLIVSGTTTGVRITGGDATPWELADVRAGLPGIATETSGEFVPQMVNLDLLGGISFSKGCYTGQEIVARTRYLGRVKRRMLRYAVPGPAPAPGTAIVAGGHTAGQVVGAAAAGSGCELLAVIQLDRLPATLELPDGRPLTALALPYAIPGLDAPESATGA